MTVKQSFACAKHAMTRSSCVTAAGCGEEEGALWACRPWPMDGCINTSRSLHLDNRPASTQRRHLHRARPRPAVPSISFGAISSGSLVRPKTDSVAVSAVPLNHSGACNYPPPRAETVPDVTVPQQPFPLGLQQHLHPKRESSKQSEASGPQRLTPQQSCRE
jgi:hypothetical protein